MEILLVARSVGKPTASAALKNEGHAGLIFNLGKGGVNDHWLAQGGPNNGILKGGIHQCSSSGWYKDFSTSVGAIWDTKQTLVVPVSVLMSISYPDKSVKELSTMVEEINKRGLRYNYETGPNSNSYVKMLMDKLGLGYKASTVPAGRLALKGWNYR
jgi:hypothetical protein